MFNEMGKRYEFISQLESTFNKRFIRTSKKTLIFQLLCFIVVMIDYLMKKL